MASSPSCSCAGRSMLIPQTPAGCNSARLCGRSDREDCPCGAAALCMQGTCIGIHASAGALSFVPIFIALLNSLGKPTKQCGKSPLDMEMGGIFLMQLSDANESGQNDDLALKDADPHSDTAMRKRLHACSEGRAGSSQGAVAAWSQSCLTWSLPAHDTHLIFPSVLLPPAPCLLDRCTGPQHAVLAGALANDGASSSDGPESR